MRLLPALLAVALTALPSRPQESRRASPILEQPIFEGARGPHALVAFPDGRPLLVYQTSNRRLSLASTRNGGRTWFAAAVDRNPRRGAWIDATVTGEETLLVAYADEEARALRFGRSRDGGVRFDRFLELDADGLPGAYCSILAPGDERVGIAHYDGATHALELLRSEDLGETWDTIVVDDAGDPGRWCRLVALDALRWVVLYQEGARKCLRVARSADAGLTWERSDVDATPGTGAYLDAIATPSGELVAVYRDFAANRARWTASTDGGATWRIDTLLELERAPAWNAVTALAPGKAVAAACGVLGEGVRFFAAEEQRWEALPASRADAPIDVFAGRMRLAPSGPSAVWWSLFEFDRSRLVLREQPVP